GEVAGRVVDVHVLRARVRRVDAPRRRRGVPVVDRRVVLDARVRAAPRRLGDVAHEPARVDRLDDGPVGAAGQLPLAAVLDRAPGLAAGPDGCRPRVGAAHEGDRAGGRAALAQMLHGPADLREVDARAGAAPEDLALLGVPGEDRVHVVLDAEDEAGRAVRLL